jgi:hypothetical protein
MSSLDAVYALQTLRKGGAVRLERIVSGATFLDNMLEKGLQDEKVEEAAALLHAYALTTACSVVGAERERVRYIAEYISHFGAAPRG